MQFVAILVESLADAKDMKPCAQTLEKFGVSYEFILASAHRGVERTEQYIKKNPNRFSPNRSFTCIRRRDANMARD